MGFTCTSSSAQAGVPRRPLPTFPMVMTTPPNNRLALLQRLDHLIAQLTDRNNLPQCKVEGMSNFQHALHGELGGSVEE